MRTVAAGLFGLVLLASSSLAQAQLSPATSSSAGICADPDSTHHPLVVCDCANLAQIAATDPSCAGVSHVVCINDFQYNPPLLQVTGGETVAFVNLETCGDFAPEDLVVNTLGVGCDTHHQVVTLPAVPGATGDALAETGICAPSPGVEGSQVPPPIPTACGTAESNVRCHTFASSGVQHYTCMTNPGHAALMHGLLVAQ